MVAVSGGDVGDAGQAERGDGEVADGGYDLGAGSGADLGSLLVVGDVSDPVDLVLDVPVTADPARDPLWPALVGWAGR